MNDLPLSERIDLHMKVHAGTLHISDMDLLQIRDALREHDRVMKLNDQLGDNIKRMKAAIDTAIQINRNAEHTFHRNNAIRHTVRSFALLTFGTYWAHRLLSDVVAIIMGG